MKYPQMLPGLAEAPNVGAEGWDVLGAVEEPQERRLTALTEPFCASQPQSAHTASNHQPK